MIQKSSLVSALKADPQRDNHVRSVHNAHYSYVSTEKFENATIISLNEDLALEIGFTKNEIESKTLKNQLAGNDDYLGQSFAMNYGGHQFGHWAGQLGDGRAINIGEVKSTKGIKQLQLKGAGPTPYSRRGDGYAVLRSSIREHLCSEAMHHLGVPTTRSLSLALSGNDVYRDMFYDGNAAYEKGAIVCRVAASFIRFGNFQIHAVNNEKEELRQIADYTIENYFPQIHSTGIEKYIRFFEEVANSTLTTIMHWQRVGFVHGVMNTDNMSILGLTIDYGPYGWLDNYDPGWTPNTTDNQHKRYRYGAQPEIGLWNLWQLANALYVLVEDSQPLEQILNNYKTQFQTEQLKMMRAKLGLQNQLLEDVELIQKLDELMQLHETDMTIFYRELGKIDYRTNIDQAIEIITVSFYNANQMPSSTIDKWREWMIAYLQRLVEESAFAKVRSHQMQHTNPKYVLRNYIAQLVIEDAEKGNYKLLDEVNSMLKNPYAEQPEMEKWYAKRPDWARNKPGSSQLSCSS